MNQRRVHVETLRIRIPRSRADQAATIARAVGEQILRGITESTAAETGGRSIDATTPVTLRAGRLGEVQDLPAQAATQVARRLRERTE